MKRTARWILCGFISCLSQWSVSAETMGKKTIELDMAELSVVGIRSCVEPQDLREGIDSECEMTGLTQLSKYAFQFKIFRRDYPIVPNDPILVDGTVMPSCPEEYPFRKGVDFELTLSDTHGGIKFSTPYDRFDDRNFCGGGGLDSIADMTLYIDRAVGSMRCADGYINVSLNNAFTPPTLNYGIDLTSRDYTGDGQLAFDGVITIHPVDTCEM